MTIIAPQICAILQKMVQTCEDAQFRSRARKIACDSDLRGAPDPRAGTCRPGTGRKAASHLQVGARDQPRPALSDHGHMLG